MIDAWGWDFLSRPNSVGNEDPHESPIYQPVKVEGASFPTGRASEFFRVFKGFCILKTDAEKGEILFQEFSVTQNRIL